MSKGDKREKIFCSRTTSVGIQTGAQKATVGERNSATRGFVKLIRKTSVDPSLWSDRERWGRRRDMIRQNMSKRQCTRRPTMDKM